MCSLPSSWPRASACLVLSTLLLLVALSACSGAATYDSIMSATSNGQPGPAGLTATKMGAHGINVSWSRVTDAKGFHVESSTDGGDWISDSSLLAWPNVTGVGWGNMPGSRIQVRVRTVLSYGTVSEWAGPVEVSFGGGSSSSGSARDECTAAFKAAEADPSGTAENAYRQSVIVCGTVSHWVAVASDYPGAFGLTSASFFDPKEWLDLICNSYASAGVCVDYRAHGI